MEPVQVMDEIKVSDLPKLRKEGKYLIRIKGSNNEAKNIKKFLGTMGLNEDNIFIVASDSFNIMEIE